MMSKRGYCHLYYYQLNKLWKKKDNKWKKISCGTDGVEYCDTPNIW